MRYSQKIKKSNIYTERLQLIPVSFEIAEQIRNGDFFIKNKSHIRSTALWPDDDFLDILPKIIQKLKSISDHKGFTSYLVVKKEDRTVIGDVGFKTPPNEAGEVDIGYGLISSERKKGYATEAVNALVNWAFEQKDVKVITADCKMDNEASIKVLKKTGAIRISVQHGMINWKIERR